MSSKNLLSETLYISLDVVLEIHRRQLKEFGGSDGIRNRAGLESAVETPRASFNGGDLYPTIFEKAAAYSFHIAESQAFVDGNKRTALDVALTFLAINGHDIKNESMELFDAMIAVAEKRMSKREFAALFKKLVGAE
jgi:death-on-curing protein